MEIGTIFNAKDKLGREYRYKLLSTGDDNPCFEYKLHNLTNDTLTEVEKEWFNQRDITILN